MRYEKCAWEVEEERGGKRREGRRAGVQTAWVPTNRPACCLLERSVLCARRSKLGRVRSQTFFPFTLLLPPSLSPSFLLHLDIKPFQVQNDVHSGGCVFLM